MSDPGQKVTPSLMFDGNAEEAANFYVGLFPNSRIISIQRAAAENPSTQEGDVLVVEFQLDGHRYVGINGGPSFVFSEAVSFQIDCADQAEVDYYWELLIADGGSPSMCGWCKDKFGLSWQVIPRRMMELLSDPDPDASKRAFQAMLSMEKLDVAEIERAAFPD